MVTELNHAIYQNKRVDLTHKIRKWKQLSQFRRTCSKVIQIKKDNFDDEQRVQERQQNEGPRAYISVFVAYLAIPSSSYEHQPRNDNNIPCKAVW